MTNNILQSDISADIEERKALLLQTKLIPIRYNFNSSDVQFFLNYSMPIIYSVWEGFIQTTFQTYIREINRFAHSFDDLCEPIVIRNMEFKFKQLRQYPEKNSQKLRYFDNLRFCLSTPPFSIVSVVNTESNVGFKVLNKILLEFNMTPIPEYPRERFSFAAELDTFLLKIRNDVAHGQNAIIVKRDDIIRAINLVEELMQLVFDRVKDAYDNKTHLKIP